MNEYGGSRSWNILNAHDFLSACILAHAAKEMMNRGLYEMQQQNKEIIVVDPQKELESSVSVLDTDDKDKWSISS
mgnify:CR=1 FL=1